MSTRGIISCRCFLRRGKQTSLSITGLLRLWTNIFIKWAISIDRILNMVAACRPVIPGLWGGRLRESRGDGDRLYGKLTMMKTTEPVNFFKGVGMGLLFSACMVALVWLMMAVIS